ncbi:MAG: CRP/FNR family cyclic AMP-dependent transcriptional regulator [Lentisphaeria bacterium]|jgi:CRP/FNR family cyclic AMP-dependent transcriptional regulator
MEVQPLTKYPQESLDKLLFAIPFYRSVKALDQYQFDILMRHSRVIEYRPGEVILEKGHKEEWLYFLLKGQLEVRSGNGGENCAIVNYITPGEVFGDLAVLFDHQRTATVVADSNSKKILVFATSFQVFGQLQDKHPITLATKLIYYRNMVHNLRWKLEVYRVSHPDKPFASSHRKVKLYTGAKDTLEELQNLDMQARELARLLLNWNDEFNHFSNSPRNDMDSDSINALG